MSLTSTPVCVVPLRRSKPSANTRRNKHIINTSRRFSVRITCLLRCVCRANAAYTWNRKCHFEGISITGCTGSCHFDNFQCSQWWKVHQNDDIFDSVIEGYSTPICDARPKWAYMVIQVRGLGSLSCWLTLRSTQNMVQSPMNLFVVFSWTRWIYTQDINGPCNRKPFHPTNHL